MKFWSSLENSMWGEKSKRVRVKLKKKKSMKHQSCLVWKQRCGHWVFDDHHLMLDWGFSRVPAWGRGASSSSVMRNPRKPYRMQRASVNNVVAGAQPLRPDCGLGSQLYSFATCRTLGSLLIYLVHASVSAFVKDRDYIRTHRSRELWKFWKDVILINTENSTWHIGKAK